MATKSISQLADGTVQVTTVETIDGSKFLSDLQDQLATSIQRSVELEKNRNSYDPLIAEEQQKQKDLQAQIDAIAAGVKA